MGSIFSRAPGEEETNTATQTAHKTRDLRKTPTAHDLEPPVKKRRTQSKKPPPNRAIQPPTRAMKHAIFHPANPKHTLPAQPNAVTGDAQIAALQPSETKYRRKRKVAVFLGYIGEKYYGMQINPGVVTVEQVLLRAFYNAGVISEANKDSLSKVHWMRAARTDKGVSAAGQCVSAKLECEVDRSVDASVVRLINHHLPEDVEVYGMLRATAGFNARSDCHRRRYEYMFPVRLLGGGNGIQNELEEGKGDPRAAKLTSILRLYQGTHCFANFTDGLAGSDDAARRYMIRVQCGQPFLPPRSGVYFVSIEIYGQSFLLHQIRKMVGLALFVYHGYAPIETISVALSPHIRLPTPMAPALGLLLDSLFFENYNKRFGSKLEYPISSDRFAEVKDTFKAKRIYAKIAETERMERTLETWFKTCDQKLIYNQDDIFQNHKKFVLTKKGKEEQRKAYVASLYPIITDENAFFSDTSENMRRTANFMKDQFMARFGTRPSFFARAPGRVILIGEHLDYNGLPVVGTALPQSTIVAGCLDNTELIEVQHVEGEKYNSGRLRTDGLKMANDDTGAGTADSCWIEYVSWGLKALVNVLPTKRTVSGGGKLLFSGDVPRAGGLGSSSSLVTASTLAGARLNRKRVPKLDMALHAAEGERIGAGTKGGAVDHCISMCGVRGSAVQVSFVPKVSVEELPLPSGMTLFAVNSKRIAEKGFDDYVKAQFNLRAAECRIGAALLARRLNVHLEKSVTTPGQLLFQARKTSKLQCKSIAMLMKKSLHVMKPNEIATSVGAQEELGVTDAEWNNRYLLGAETQELAVGKRMCHVLSEAERVEKWAAVLNDAALPSVRKIEELGKILNEGHESLTTMFQSSCEEVDQLVLFCREAGALGSRMTGAGWGGYTINVVRSEEAAEFYRAVSRRVGKDGIFEVRPAAGASILAMHPSVGTPVQSKQQENNDTERQ